MSRFCQCGKGITNRRWICSECGSIYGYVASEWPEWLRLIVNDNNRVELSDKRHEHLSLDEIEPNGRGGYRAKPTFALRGCREISHVHE